MLQCATGLHVGGTCRTYCDTYTAACMRLNTDADGSRRQLRANRREIAPTLRDSQVTHTDAKSLVKLFEHLIDRRIAR